MALASELHAPDQSIPRAGLLRLNVDSLILQPKTEYARSGKLHITCQVVGHGPRELVYVPGWVSHGELAWEEPALARFLNRLASFSRLIVFDKCGTEWTTCAR